MQIMYVSAAPGDPSTLWQSNSGKYYRTRKEALADQGRVINPNDVEIKTSFWVKWRKLIIYCAVAAVVSALVTMYCVKSK